MIPAVLFTIWVFGSFGGLFFFILPKKNWPLVANRRRALGLCLGSFVGAPMINAFLPSSLKFMDRGLLSGLITGTIVAGVVVLVMWVRIKHTNRIKLARQALDNFKVELASSYAFIFHAASGNLLCMDREGTELRFLQVGTEGGIVRRDADLMVKMDDVVSVDLVKNERVVTETVTDTKKQGALGRAVIGELLFGPAGAIVGASSASSKSRSVGLERRIYETSELVFGLSDFQNPIVRFVSDDHIQSETWLHRIRSAMAKRTASARG